MFFRSHTFAHQATPTPPFGRVLIHLGQLTVIKAMLWNVRNTVPNTVAIILLCGSLTSFVRQNNVLLNLNKYRDEGAKRPGIELVPARREDSLAQWSRDVQLWGMDPHFMSLLDAPGHNPTDVTMFTYQTIHPALLRCTLSGAMCIPT